MKYLESLRVRQVQPPHVYLNCDRSIYKYRMRASCIGRIWIRLTGKIIFFHPLYFFKNFMFIYIGPLNFLWFFILWLSQRIFSASLATSLLLMDIKVLHKDFGWLGLTPSWNRLLNKIKIKIGCRI